MLTDLLDLCMYCTADCIYCDGDSNVTETNYESISNIQTYAKVRSFALSNVH